jgi:hypothetical protein
MGENDMKAAGRLVQLDRWQTDTVVWHHCDGCQIDAAGILVLTS